MNETLLGHDHKIFLEKDKTFTKEVKKQQKRSNKDEVHTSRGWKE